MEYLKFLSLNTGKYICSLAIIFLWGCSDQNLLFNNPDTEKLGITFQNTLTDTDDNNILDYLYFYNGGGVSMGDIDNDGLQDLFFSGNQVGNKLYLNQGNLNFLDITEKSGIGGKSSWNTGTTMADVNGDGLLDIYVCAVVGINGFKGHNELFINQGDNTFVESAKEYGLDFDTFSTHSAFFDYDLDGDLDMYLLNQAFHTKESYGKVGIRYKRNYRTGDRLLRNDGDHFVDVSAEAGIYGGANGYGLGLAIADFDQDGYPDIFVGNDFHEDDYYYINNGNGTFTEKLREHFGHTTRSSMGNDVADINHDGLPDLLSLDMLSEDEEVIKTMTGDDNENIQKIKVEEFGYYYQFARNMLFLNQPQGNFMEIALMAGVAATDWSWSGLFGDFDQDGEQDLFITNGILKRPNDKDFIKFISSDQIRNKVNNSKLVDGQAMEMMPSGNVHNYMFRGHPDLTFEDMSGHWIGENPVISGATAMGDLDNDGDLDLVTNNLNALPTLYINQTNNRSHYLKIQFKYPGKNHLGIGTKVFSYHNGTLQYKELNPSRGFQSSSAPEIHFGYGAADKVDSLKIIWPDRQYQILENVDVDQTLILSPNGTSQFDYRSLRPEIAPLFQKMEQDLGINFTHIEDNYRHFTREKLIPYEISDRGPATVVGDLDGDGKEDIFFGGSKSFPSQTYLQKDSVFQKRIYPELAMDSIKEDVTAVLADFDNDGHNDIFIGSGGANFFNAKPLTNSLFLFKNDAFIPGALPVSYENTSQVISLDYDGDGDQDIFVANQEETNKFGKPVNSYLLQNDHGVFKVVQKETFASLGMLTDVIWDDFDGDHSKDLIVVGEWMAPRFFKNTNGTFYEVFPLPKDMNGLWQCIVPFDIDQDGDRDYILGNWGTNSKFRATAKTPMKLFCGDFDGNRQYEAIAAIEKNGRYFPFEGLDEMVSQIPSLSEKFSTYASFAGKDIGQILGKEALEKSDVRSVHTLKSGYLKNENGHFSFVPFTNLLQTAPIMALLVYDFDGDQKEEVLAAGNYFGIKSSQGRLDAFPGALIKSGDSILMGYDLGLDFLKRSIRQLNVIHLGGHSYLLVTVNNGSVQLYRIKE